MISATLITLNEEENITNVLKNLEGFVDEIVVVDGGSEDKTVELAKKFNIKFFYREFDNFASQKNFALSKAKEEWVLSVDADEEIPTDLQEEIKQAVKNDKYDAFLISRKNFILGKEIKYSRWSPDKHIWLWKKGFGKWQGDVHEEVVGDGKVGQLKESKIHHSHKTLKEFIDSNNFYSTLLAKSLSMQGKRFSFGKMIYDSFFEFFVRFFYKLGFLDGWTGFILAYSMSIYQLMVWIKLWEFQQEK